MAFDNQTRNRLARLVSDCRRLLSDEFSIQLQERYGIQPDGQIMALERLVHLDDEQRGVAALLRERIDHLASGLHDEKQPLKAAIDRLLREQAFTVLNRFAALRMCEERGLVQECVRQGLQSRGFQVYLQVAGSALGDTYQRYRTFLAALFDEISVDLGLLFERYSPFGLLFPREAALEELFQLLNHADLGGVWAEDETIGWIYQYFNSKEERQAMRKASAAPRNSRELAVRNQFFTPRYVVEFLTDNTLGRIWYEMRQGRTRLSEQCRYLVRRPHEVFMQPGEAAPQPPENQDEMSQEELLRQPHYIAFRPGKDPRDLKILDPACGSGHFLLYAFDLLQTIYEEAWEVKAAPASEATGRTLAADYPQREALILAIPELVLRHNLHGIDIDPRAVQIAALALWLRSQRAWKEQNVKPTQRPRILRSHIVCAEPMPGEKGMLKEFAAALQPPLLGQIVEKIFDRMQLAGEAGSLLKIEEEIQEAIVQAKEQWQRMYERARDKKGNEMLFTQNEMDELAQERQLELGLFDVSAISEADFWDTVEERILQALSGYAERAGGEHALSRRMFAEDAARGFAFIDLCRKRYDVVLMNPPFGDSPANCVEYLKAKYNLGRPDAYMCFTMRSNNILNTSGRLGAITSKTFHSLEFFLPLRKLLLESKFNLIIMIDLSGGVLDGATVETCAFVCNQNNSDVEEKALFLNITTNNTKSDCLQKELSFLNQAMITNSYLRPLRWFSYLPGKVLCYSLHEKVFKSFVANPPLDPSAAWSSSKEIVSEKIFVKQGLIPGDLFQFTRLRVEVDQEQLQKHYWTPICRGGDFHKYYYSEDSVFNWVRDGIIPKTFAEIHYGSASRTIKNIEYFNQSALTYPRISSIGFNVRVMPKGHAFSDAGLAVITSDEKKLYSIMAFLNSRLADYVVNSIHPGRKFEIAHVSSIPLRQSVLSDEKLFQNAYDLVKLARDFETTNELSPVYMIPDLLNYQSESVDSAWGEYIESSYKKLEEYRSKLSLINDIVFDHYNFDKSEIESLNKLYENNGRSKIAISSTASNAEIRRAIEIWPERQIESLSGNSGDQLLFIYNFYSYFVGTIYGRWDLRYSINRSLLPKLCNPFNAVPINPPGMLVDHSGQSAKSGQIVSEEWLRARPDANSLPPEGSVKNPTIKDEEYPIRISWEGILVDDAFAPEGQTHPEDIIRRIREVLDVLWGERAAAIEQEACEILEVKSLRDYFRKPSGFFQDHLKRYSKSRRQAPIYWPLSSENGNYTLWIYYHRLNDQFLYTCVNDYVNPRIEEVSKDLDRLRKQMSDKPGLSDTSKSDLSRIESLEDFLLELKSFCEELLRVAQLPYKPDLNDGVIITAAPLWKLFRLPKWRKDLKACWDKLEAGDYDWAHLAYAIWPDRVRGKCVTDKSLAIAHDLEALYDDSKAPRRKRAKPQDEVEEELDEE